jgi:hypothetical protein
MYRDKLLEALASGPKKPSDLDQVLLGRLFVEGIIPGVLPPYADELGQLVRQGNVRWCFADNGDVWYELNARDS